MATVLSQGIVKLQRAQDQPDVQNTSLSEKTEDGLNLLVFRKQARLEKVGSDLTTSAV